MNEPISSAACFSIISIFTIILFILESELWICLRFRINIDFLLDFSANCDECFLHIDVRFGRSFKELNSESVSKRLAFFKGNLSLWFHIAFITNKKFCNVHASLLTDLFHPNFNISEGLFVIYRISHNHTHCAFIIILCDLSESFLASSIPNL